MDIDAMIAVLQAAKAKKPIRKRRYGTHKELHWFNCEMDSETWDFSFWHYEVMPEPREIWVHLNSHGVHSASIDRDLLGGEPILFREVIE